MIPEIPDDMMECLICLCEVANATILPCGHSCVCWACGMSIKGTEFGQCPICRGIIEDLVPVGGV